MITIDKPGLYDDVPETCYHEDPVGPAPSLSSSIAKVLIDQSPAHARHAHPRLNPAFDRGDEKYNAARAKGSAAHRLLLGTGAEIAVIDYDDFKKKDAQHERDAAMAAGETPLTRIAYEQVLEMVDAARAQIEQIPDLHGLLAPGRSEVTGVWQERDVWCRMRIDRLPDEALTEPFPTFFDVKTSGLSVHPDDYQKHMFSMGYDISDAFYKRGLLKLLPHIRQVRQVFVAIEQDAPYGVSAMMFGGQAVEEAERRVDLAIETWRACMAMNRWPMYGAGISQIDPPAWRSIGSELRVMSMQDRLAKWQAPQKKDEAA